MNESNDAGAGRDSVETKFVVGLGASAGGLEALEKFFSKCPPVTGLTFVVIQHLSPDFDSMMDTLLARFTSMKIVKVIQTVRMEPNTIYLIPPKKNLTIVGQDLVPLAQDPSLSLRLPIDIFFESLADQYKMHAIAVVLSGTGSDGTRGCAAVKENEGFVLAHDPLSATFNGMPNSVIKRGFVDKVLHPEQMPDEILRYVNGSNSQTEQINFEQDPDKMIAIARLLETVQGVDFAHYRPSTISRRIERRVKLNRLETLDEYIEMVRGDPLELKMLHSELLIGVTRFFRDGEAFDVLRSNVIPGIVAQVPEGETVRVWVAGCSTGEEVYSIAISFMEYLEKSGLRRELKVFGTDIDSEAVEVASLGCYPLSIYSEIEKDLLAKYFTRCESHFEVSTRVRRNIIFSVHNVVKDPPFTRMHLVSCRNLLIYFQPQLQEKAISLFHFGLKTNGYLFLGPSEALGGFASEFKSVDARFKFFQKLRDQKSGVSFSASFDSQLRATSRESRLRPQSPTTQQRKDEYLSSMVLDELLPPGFVIDSTLELHHVFGNAGKFLVVPVGKTSFDILKMLPKDLGLSVSTAVSRVMRMQRDVVFSQTVSLRDRSVEVDVRVKALPGKTHQAKTFILVTIQERNMAALSTVADSLSVPAISQEEVSSLQEQIRIVKESLQTSIEQLETANEELQSTNEELMSSNEELQSSNEELQSVNEELYTVNNEYQLKIDELSQANSDIDFLLRTSKIGIIFFDGNLCIRQFNSSIEQFVSVLRQDVGRPISDLTFKLSHAKIIDTLHQVLKIRKELSFESSFAGKVYFVRCIPHEIDMEDSRQPSPKGRNFRETEQGVVLSIVEIPTREATSG